MILKFSINSGQQLRFPSNVKSSKGGAFFASRCLYTALEIAIFPPGLVSNVVSYPFTNTSFNKSNGSSVVTI